MSQHKVVLHAEMTDQHYDRLVADHPNCEFKRCDTYQDLPALLDDFQPNILYGVKFAGNAGYPRDAILQSTSLKWMQVGGSGVDHLQPWDPDAITITNSSGVAASIMAQYAIGAMLHFSLNFKTFEDDRKERAWKVRTVSGIEGKTLLIIGLGKTGQAIAKRAKGLGMHIIGVRATPRATENVDEVFGMEDLPNLWGRADFITVIVPLLDSTRGLVGKDAFDAMQDHSIFIDISRGCVTDGDALYEALSNQKIAGAALDVFEEEPLCADSPFWDLTNVIISPHCSSVDAGWEDRSVQIFSDNLKNYEAGHALFNIVDPQKGY